MSFVVVVVVVVVVVIAPFFAEASELRSLVATCRAHCRSLSRPDVLECAAQFQLWQLFSVVHIARLRSILQPLEEGFQEMRGPSPAWRMGE